jgi:hypothetical protein
VGGRKAEQNGGKTIQWNKVAHFMAVRKQRRSTQERVRDKIPLKTMPPRIYF